MPAVRRSLTVGQVNVLHLELGAPVHCAGTRTGELADVVLEPSSGVVTHVVVRLGETHESRMIPLALVTAGDDDGLALSCTETQLREFEPMQQFAYLPAGELPHVEADHDIGVTTVVTTPSFDAAGISLYAVGEPDVGVTYDPVPKGEVELRRASIVTSADDHHLGHVARIDVGEGGRVEALVIDHRSLWRHRRSRIPVADVERFETDAVRLRLSKEQSLT